MFKKQQKYDLIYFDHQKERISFMQEKKEWDLCLTFRMM